MVEFLLTNSVRQADANTENWQTRPIWQAIEVGNFEILKLLLQKANEKVDLECRNPFSRDRPGWTVYEDVMLTPLTRAIELGNFEIAQELISAGADVNARCVTTGPTEYTVPPIIFAALGYRLDICWLLLKHDCDVTAHHSPAPGFNLTALDSAVQTAYHFNQRPHFKQMLQWVHLNDPDGNDDYALVKLLLKHMPPNNFSSAMEMALSSCGVLGVNMPLAQLLLEHGYKWQVHWNPE